MILEGREENPFTRAAAPPCRAAAPAAKSCTSTQTSRGTGLGADFGGCAREACGRGATFH